MEKDVTLCYKPPVNSFLLVEYLLYVSLEGMKVAVAKIIQGTCVYCGKENALGEVHVIPQCLFPKGLSGDMPTVGMCKSCNKEEKTANEISLIDFLLQARDSSDHPTAQQLYEKYDHAIRQSQSTLNPDAMESESMPGSTPSSIVLGWAHGTELPGGQIIAALSTMVRGLYNTYTGGILPENTIFKVFRMRDGSQIEMSSYLLLHMGGHYVRVGNGEEFECIFATGLQKPELSRWLLFFYKSVIFSVATSHPLS